MLAVVVEIEELLQTALVSVVAGVGITVVFSIAIWGAARFVDLSSSERPVAAAAAATVGLLGLLVTLATVAVGLLVMMSK